MNLFYLLLNGSNVLHLLSRSTSTEMQGIQGENIINLIQQGAKRESLFLFLNVARF